MNWNNCSFVFGFILKTRPLKIATVIEPKTIATLPFTIDRLKNLITTISIETIHRYIPKLISHLTTESINKKIINIYFHFKFYSFEFCHEEQMNANENNKILQLLSLGLGLNAAAAIATVIDAVFTVAADAAYFSPHQAKCLYIKTNAYRFKFDRKEETNPYAWCTESANITNIT